jgi:hypothetical protein
MQNESSALPRVPFTVPIPDMTFEAYCHYQSWRIAIQVLATSVVDKTFPKSKIIEQLVDINRMAECFPVQPLPDNLRTIALELTDPNSKPGILCMPLLLQELAKLFP